MNNFIKTSFLASAFVVALALVNSSCKKKFDAPPPYAALGMTANTTIRELKARHTNSSNVEFIADDVIIKGIVIADDKSGNYYKSLVIQDATGGILIRLEGTSLYTAYPVGMELFIKCKGLYLGDYNGLIQLGGDVDNTGTFPSILTVPSSLFGTFLVKGSTGNVVTPRVVTTSMLTTSMQDTFQNTLIKLDGFEFGAADITKTYATPTPPTSVNFLIKDCSGNSITLRNSGFANFVSVNVPDGNGSIVSVYTVFGSTKQLTIRDTSDVQFYGTRCGGGGGSGGTGVLADISAIRALYTGTNTTVPANTKITGIVISDRVALNTQSQNIVIQQGNGLKGIMVRFASATPAHTFNVGDSIDIVVSGATLSPFSGLLQISNVPLANATLVSPGKVITPRVATIAEVNSNQAAWESTLVQMLNVTISSTAGTTWSGTTKFTDATGTVDHFARTGATGATFGGTAFPTGVRSSITAIVSKFNTTPQVGIRNPADVQ